MKNNTKLQCPEIFIEDSQSQDIPVPLSLNFSKHKNHHSPQKNRQIIPRQKFIFQYMTRVDERVPNRISEACSKDDIVVYQGPTTPLPNGIPTYTVQILNVCVSSGGCSISNIHVSCGWFSSARLINPRLFRRQNYDDCLVNNGEALEPGDSLSFQYANSFQYPLYVSSVAC
ncbi:hypothetical protein MKW94_023698 [Papaver nudicaule]|uniref:Uncharacterized protein n=1 Tax=Papaver nudicaule TaxID=74823 RepID=A0AA42AW93_PAPNU|nr:hypothetical protein [Papaver nudicaule]